MAPGDLRGRVKKLLTRAETLPAPLTEAQARGARERLHRRLGAMGERMPENRAAWEALTPDEKAMAQADLRERLLERLRALGLRR